MGKYELALEYHKKELPIEQELWKIRPNNRWYGLNLSNCLSGLSSLYRRMGEHESAIQAKRQSHHIRKQLYDDSQANKESEDGLGPSNLVEKYGKSCFELAELLILSGDVGMSAEAEKLLEQGIPILESLHRDSPSNDSYRGLYSAALTVRSQLFAQAGRSQDATTWAERAFSVFEGPQISEHKEANDQREIAVSMWLFCLTQSGDETDIYRALDKAIAIHIEKSRRKDEVTWNRHCVESIRIMRNNGLDVDKYLDKHLPTAGYSEQDYRDLIKKLQEASKTQPLGQ